MKLQFDANQQFQIDAVNTLTDLFDGQPRGMADFSVIDLGAAGAEAGMFAGQQQTELGVGNQLLIDDDRLRDNARKVQDRNDIELLDQKAPLEAWDLFDAPLNRSRKCPHFSVEMETGTGKTYVYLRSIFELHRRYGFSKFVIVVPSVAIREGVLKNLQITAEHFKALYSQEAEHFVYDAKRVNRLRQFATSTTPQILVINIDAFRKNFTGTDAEKKSNVIYKESDKLSGRQPIEFVQAARPIVIIDEPQSVDATDKAQEAIKALNPLCTLRYSATHRNPYNLVYRLDPVRAFELRLVKQIVVASAKTQGGEGAGGGAFVRVEAIDYKPSIKAKLRLLVQGNDGPKEKSVTVKQGSDLFSLSNERAEYREGYEVAEISAEPGSEFIRFASGRVLRLGAETGGLRDDVWKVQIKRTIEEHLKKEVRIREARAPLGEAGTIKVLSLFFIDRVANYRDYGTDGQPGKGKFAIEFETALAELAKDERFKDIEWLKTPVEKLHNGYFSQDKKGIAKDTRGDTQADDDTYALIMKEKERLLSIDEPLRFIFSHSALREGWDNPNVFQICTLNETTSAIKKRQEIGRGLRLPVDASGRRVFDASINKLYVMANESYEDFAKALQKEYAEDCGVTFGRVPMTALSKLSRVIDDQPTPIGREAAEEIRQSLMQQGFLDAEGKIQPKFDPKSPSFKVELPDGLKSLTSAVTDLLSSYQIEQHIRSDRDEKSNRLRKEVVITPEFQELWERIKPKTTYRVEFETEELVRRAVQAIKLKMSHIEKPKISVQTGGVQVKRGGVTTTAIGAAIEQVEQTNRPIPDVLAYLQNETELTRSTIFRVLKESGRLDEFFNNPQRFMDEVAAILKHELHRLLVDGIKYERVVGTGPAAEWEQMLFKNDELVNFLAAVKVTKSVYEYVVYDSEVERKFAEQLDQREDIKLFVKLPDWFKIETPIGTYNPDWAILKQDGQALYLVRETKGTRDFLKLRTSEADKVNCGKKHFEAIGVPFAVVVTADEV
jgi:type III restriction enzyme